MKSGFDRTPYLSKVQHIHLFRHLSAEAAAFLMERAEFLKFYPQEKIVAEGDLSPSFFGILEGTVYVAVNREGHEVYFNTLGEGDVFGEAAMFLNAPRTADVIAASENIVIKLTRFDITDFLKAFPEDGNKFLLTVIYSVLQKLRATDAELAYERKIDVNQAEVDAMINGLMGKL